MITEILLVTLAGILTTGIAIKAVNDNKKKDNELDKKHKELVLAQNKTISNLEEQKDLQKDLQKKSNEIISLNEKLNESSEEVSGKITEQASLIDKLRMENTDLYSKLANSQNLIFRNTERSLEPLSITNISTTLTFDFNDPNIATVKNHLFNIKKDLEIKCATYRAGVTNKSIFPDFSGIVYSPSESNKITDLLSIADQDLINKMDFVCPNLVYQIFTKEPSETKEKATDGTFLIKRDNPSLELKYDGRSEHVLENVMVSFINEKITILLKVKEWNYTKNNGEIVSFRDLYDRHLKVSAFYNGYQNNLIKMAINDATIVNDKKKIYLIFSINDKSKSEIEYNAAFTKVISEKDVKQ